MRNVCGITGWMILFIAGCGGLDINMLSSNKDVTQAFKMAKAATKIGTAAIPINTEKEIQIGRVVAARVAGRYGIYHDPGLTHYVALVGLAAVLSSDRTDLVYHFAILDTDEANAFAAPGGYIFVTRGTLRELENEAQLAAVLAHEVAHVARRHIIKAVQKANLTAAVTSSAADVMDVKGELFKNVTNFATDMVFKGLSREDEYEADRFGTEYAYRVGYQPSGLKEFLEHLQSTGAAKDRSGASQLFATHPKPSDRIKELDKVIREKGLASVNLPRLSDRYRNEITIRN